MKNGCSFGGIAVQLCLWMKIFVAKGWNVHSISTVETTIDELGIHYHKIRHINKLDLVYDWLTMWRIINTVRPDLIMIRGAQRAVYPLSRIAHLFGAKLVMFGASDINFVPGKATVGNGINRKLYERALRKHIDYFIVQNQYQAETLNKHFGRDSLTLLNIWDETLSAGKIADKKYDIIWVSNFRRLKRAEWIVDAAKTLPQYKFGIIGAPNDKEYYMEITQLALMVPNIDIIGPKSLHETTEIIANSCLLTCTSEYEGFPNTFLQAWSANIPIISTVDPSGIIASNNLGRIVSSFTEFVETLNRLLMLKEELQTMQKSISQFFRENISAEKSYNKLINHVKLC